MNSKPQNQTSNRLNQTIWLLILMVISLATIAVHSYLTVQHYQLKLGIAEGRSICNLNAVFNCDSVAISRYAALFGIPMALLGLISQIVFFILLVAVRFELSSHSAWLRRFLLWFSIFIVGTSIVMASISSFLLGTFCLFCMAAYALSILQIIGAWKAQTEPAFTHLSADLGALFQQSRWVLILLILVPTLGWMLNSMVLDSYGFGRLEVAIRDSLANWEAAPIQEFKEDQGLVLYHGSGPAKMTVVEFADFLCPHCKAASPTLEAFVQSHPDARLIFKTFPLDGKCNKSVQHQGDGMRCRLAAIMVCAQNLNRKGWDAHHWIFERQEKIFNFPNEPLTDNISKDLGLDKASLETCMSSDATQDAIQAMAQEGAKIAGTPTVFVNGKILERGQALPVLEALYQKLTH